MKTRHIFLSVIICIFAVAQMSAITFVNGDQIFIEANQHANDGGSWVPTGSQKLYIYIWNGTGSQFVQLTQDNGTVYGATMPAGTWADQYIIVRSTDGGWGGKDRQTENLSWARRYQDGEGNWQTAPGFPEKNCLNIFKTKGKDDDTYTDWTFYSPAAAHVPNVSTLTGGIVTEEQISICPNALGGPFSLRVKLNAAKTDYDYDNVTSHAWYRSVNAATWESVDSYAGGKRDDEGDKAIIANNLPESLPNGYIYYYLYSARIAGRRLIKITTDAADCDLDCTITAFEVACSDVNANDTTYTLDGMVAFGEPSGDLVISCGGKSVTIPSAKSPQIFSIPGLKAALTGGNQATAHAEFNGNTTKCQADATFDIPNATQGITRKHLDVLVGETTTLQPAGIASAYQHEWYIDGVKVDNQGVQTTTAHYEANTTSYTYREYNPPTGDMTDMMSNGGYETNTESFYGTKGQPSTISEYNFWGLYPQTGTTDIDFYNNTTLNPNKWNDNGFAIVKNAHNFFLTFAKVQPREGAFFALFDAASGAAGGNKKAWKAETSNNPDLKLQAGTTYLFSFWAANINNYGEMDNAAKLQFQIEYNGKTKKLGSVLDLGNPVFRNNRWHQCSATFYADADAANVTISVVNLNTNTLNTGNDFALDDIQFRAVSSATRAVKTQIVYEVQTHVPHIYSLTAVPQALPCDSTNYAVKLSIVYDNPKGNLIVTDETTDNELFNQPVLPAGGTPDWDNKKTQTLTIRIEGLTPAVHSYKATFAGWNEAVATGTSTASNFTPCPPDDPEPTCVENMYRKWTNVLFVNNKDSLYVAYQWYKNDKPLNGETLQRYYVPDGNLVGTTDIYHCVMTRKDGAKDETCKHTFDECPRSADVSAIDLLADGVTVYPTQVVAGGNVTICKTYTGDVEVTLLTLTGQVVTTMQLHQQSGTITMPAASGLYLLRLEGANAQSIVKINVK